MGMHKMNSKNCRKTAFVSLLAGFLGGFLGLGNTLSQFQKILNFIIN